MKLAPREIVVVSVGALIVLGAAIVWLPGALHARDGAIDTGDPLEEGIALIEDYATLSRSLERERTEMKITLPDGSLDDQEARMRRDLNYLAQQKSVAVSGIRRVESGGGRRGGLRPIQFQLDGSGLFPALVRFFYALEHSPTPFIVQDFAVSSAGATGQVQVVLTVQGYPIPTADTIQAMPAAEEEE